MLSEKEQEKTIFIVSNYNYAKRLALKFSPLPAFVEDIVQQTFLEISEGWEKWDTSRDMRPLLVVITKRVSQKFWRQHLKHQPEALREIAETIRQMNREELPPERHDEEIRALRHCLTILPQKSRRIIEMYYFEHYSTSRLADDLGIKQSSVWSAVCRIRDVLRECIRKTVNANLRRDEQ